MKIKTSWFLLILAFSLSYTGIPKLEQLKNLPIPNFQSNKISSTTQSHDLDLEKVGFKGITEDNKATSNDHFWWSDGLASIHKPKVRRAESKVSRVKPSDSCDQIILTNGDVLYGSIFEISDSEIQYQACDYLEGPLVKISTSEVFMLRYKNGTSSILNEIESSETERSLKDEQSKYIPYEVKSRETLTKEIRKDDRLSKWALFFSILSLGFIPAALVSLIISPRIMLRRRNSKTKAFRKIWHRAIYALTITIFSIVVFTTMILIFSAY